MTPTHTFDPLELPCHVCAAAPRQPCRWHDPRNHELWTFRRPHHQRVTAARCASGPPQRRRTAHR